MLKNTNCNCEFTDVTFYCHDCPALMCSKCIDRLHPASTVEKHNIRSFVNSELNWNDKSMIFNLFNDNNKLAEDIFQEVSRPIYQKSGISSSSNRFHSRQDQYEQKIQATLSDVISHMKVLDDFQDISIENVLQVFFNRRNNAKIPIIDWHKKEYLQNRSASMIYRIIHETGHNIGLESIKCQYNDFDQKKNQEIMKEISQQNIANQLLGRSHLLNISEIHKSNKLSIHLPKRTVSAKELWEIIIKNRDYTQNEIRCLMVELDINDNDKITLLHNFIEDKTLGDHLKTSFPEGIVTLSHIRQALLENHLIDKALKFLKVECETCFGSFPMPEIRELMTCEHRLCKTCTSIWLNDMIKNKYPWQWSCSLCPPDSYKDIDTDLHYFNLGQLLSEDKKLKALLDQKLFQETVMTNPNFHWCPNEKCGNGFETEISVTQKFQCALCKTYLCLNCNRKWQEEHANKSCEEFELWILQEDPSVLNIIGIECPNCGMRYSLAPGGCLHFRCVHCGTDFCGSCNCTFTKKCNHSTCSRNDFHAHHPRNCFYYLRDYDIQDLEQMLEGHSYPQLEGKLNRSCELIEYDTSFKEKECEKIVHETTGICVQHCKEYLVEFIIKYKIDPADFADTTGLNLMLQQLLFPPLEISPNEDDDEFKGRLLKEVKEKCFLKNPSKKKIGN